MNRDYDLFKDRDDYGKTRLDEDALAQSPWTQLQAWMDEARSSGIQEANAMSLATSSSDGAPAVRIVLLKRLDSRGLVFYSNYRSRKGRELSTNPRVALGFYWMSNHRQVRVEGSVEPLDLETSKAYFETRPRDSQIAAWASPQSEVLENREALESKWKEMNERFKDKDVPLPPFWGGYLISPQRYEFWQGHSDRMHDRIVYDLSKSGDWSRYRLAP